MEVFICPVELTLVSRKPQLVLHPVGPGAAAPAQHSLAPGRLSGRWTRLSPHGQLRAGAEGLATLCLAQLCPLSTVVGASGTIKGSLCPLHPKPLLKAAIPPFSGVILFVLTN